MIPQEGSAGFIVSQLAGGHADLGVTFFPSAKAQIEAGDGSMHSRSRERTVSRKI